MELALFNLSFLSINKTTINLRSPFNIKEDLQLSLNPLSQQEASLFYHFPHIVQFRYNTSELRFIYIFIKLILYSKVG